MTNAAREELGSAREVKCECHGKHCPVETVMVVQEPIKW